MNILCYINYINSIGILCGCIDLIIVNLDGGWGRVDDLIEYCWTF